MSASRPPPFNCGAKNHLCRPPPPSPEPPQSRQAWWQGEGRHRRRRRRMRGTVLSSPAAQMACGAPTPPLRRATRRWRCKRAPPARRSSFGGPKSGTTSCACHISATSTLPSSVRLQRFRDARVRARAVRRDGVAEGLVAGLHVVHARRNPPPYSSTVLPYTYKLHEPA